MVLCLCCLLSFCNNVVLFLFLLFCFQVLSFYIPVKKKGTKWTQQKPNKNKNAEKRDKIKSASAVVFTNNAPNFVGWA